MKCVLYLRKSRADAEAELRGEGETLARHEKILLEVAKNQKLHIEAIYKEIVSGESIAARPIMQKLLSEVEQGLWDGVLVVELERLARGETIDQGIMAQTFKYSSTKIITPNKTYDPNNEFDEEYFEFGLFMSRREYKTINRRLQQGRVSSVKEGKYVGNKPPYGYLRQQLTGQKGFTLIPHPDEAPIVKMIFELYAHGDNGNRIGVSLIVRKLNNMKIPAQKNNDWTNATIQGILRNPVYIGKIRWNWRPTVKKVVEGVVTKSRPKAKEEDWTIADGMHPAIIDIDTFNRANELIDTNRPRPNPSQTTTQNPLSGIVRCGICDRSMVRRPYAKKGQSASLMCPQTSCKNISSPLDDVEEDILIELGEWLAKYKAETQEYNHCAIDVEILKKQLEKYQEEDSSLSKQFEKTHELLEKGIYDTDTFLLRTKTISEQIKELQENTNSIQEQIKIIQQQETAKKSFIPTLEKIVNTYNLLPTPAEKNDLLKLVLEKVTYIKTEKTTKKKIAIFSLKLYPRIRL